MFSSLIQIKVLFVYPHFLCASLTFNHAFSFTFIIRTGKYFVLCLADTLSFMIYFHILILLHFQDGQTVLHVAASAGRLETVEALLDRGCDSNVQDFVSALVIIFYYWRLSMSVHIMQNSVSALCVLGVILNIFLKCFLSQIVIRWHYRVDS